MYLMLCICINMQKLGPKGEINCYYFVSKHIILGSTLPCWFQKIIFNSYGPKQQEIHTFYFYWKLSDLCHFCPNLDNTYKAFKIILKIFHEFTSMISPQEYEKVISDNRMEITRCKLRKFSKQLEVVKQSIQRFNRLVLHNRVGEWFLEHGHS